MATEKTEAPPPRPVHVVMRLTELDWAIITEIRERLGCGSTAAAVRYALREFHRLVTTGAPPWLPPAPDMNDDGERAAS